MFDIEQNRRSVRWSKRELMGRLAWRISSVLFSASPRPFWGWRRFLLRVFGAEIGKEAHIYPSVKVAIPWNLFLEAHTAIGEGVNIYNLGVLRIGQRCTISQYAHLCGGTHDYTKQTFPLVKSQITIGDDVWVAADAFIGPDVTIGHQAIVGARAVVMNDVPDRTIVAGNPARVIRDRPVPGL